MKERIARTVLATALSAPAALINLLPNSLNMIINNRIYSGDEFYKTQEELEKAFAEEKRHLGLETCPLSLKVDRRFKVAYFNSVTKRIGLPENFVKPCILRHEMKHAKDFYSGEWGAWAYHCIPLVRPYKEFMATHYAIKRTREDNELNVETGK